MATAARRDDLVGKLDEGDLVAYLSRHCDARETEQLVASLHRLDGRGLAEIQRLLGPRRYVEVMALLRAGGFDY